MKTFNKTLAYKKAQKDIHHSLLGETQVITKMATINCILKQYLPYYFWVGFYIVYKPKELIVGPYQGTHGCLRIPFSKGVCGAAAREQKTQLVPDVHQFSGHIACDSQTNSEIVLPVFNNKEKLIAVFDVDSTEKNSFCEIDQQFLEAILYEQFSSDLLEWTW
jgi:L-methionine (R)-S-oxide reductase